MRLGGSHLKASQGNMNRARLTAGMAQAVEYLLCKYKVLSSNSSSTIDKWIDRQTDRQAGRN
jgi:hypothetical protein